MRWPVLFAPAVAVQPTVDSLRHLVSGCRNEYHVCGDGTSWGVDASQCFPSSTTRQPTRSELKSALEACGLGLCGVGTTWVESECVRIPPSVSGGEAFRRTTRCLRSSLQRTDFVDTMRPYVQRCYPMGVENATLAIHVTHPDGDRTVRCPRPPLTTKTAIRRSVPGYRGYVQCPQELPPRFEVYPGSP